MAAGRRTSVQPDSLETAGRLVTDPSNSIAWIDFRDLTVARGRGLETPFLRLEGQWLRKAGFPVGSKVMVSVAEGRLVIEPISTRQALLFDASPNAAAPEKGLTIQDPTSKPAQMTRASVPADRRTEDQGSDSKPQSWPQIRGTAVPSRS
jgi:virulence-associated protein VagC